MPHSAERPSPSQRELRSGIAKPRKWDQQRLFALLTTDPAGMTKAELQSRGGLGRAYDDRVQSLLSSWRKHGGARLVRREGGIGYWQRLMEPEQLAEVFRPRQAMAPRQPRAGGTPQQRAEPPMPYIKAYAQICSLQAMVRAQMERKR